MVRGLPPATRSIGTILKITHLLETKHTANTQTCRVSPEACLEEKLYVDALELQTEDDASSEGYGWSDAHNTSGSSGESQGCLEARIAAALSAPIHTASTLARPPSPPPRGPESVQAASELNQALTQIWREQAELNTRFRSLAARQRSAALLARDCDAYRHKLGAIQAIALAASSAEADSDIGAADLARLLELVAIPPGSES